MLGGALTMPRTAENSIRLESALARFERRFLTTDCRHVVTDFHEFYAESSEFAGNRTLHLLDEEIGLHHSFKIRVSCVIRGSNF